MTWKMIAAPLVGAIIGYLTNWIAVKMLFHPRYEKRIGNWKVPFTPGVIPKGQPRLARAIGNAVKTQLLTREVMEKILLSDEMKARLAESVRRWIDERKQSERTVRETALTVMDEDALSDISVYVREKGAEYLLSRVQEMDLTHLLTEKIIDIAREKLAESMLGAMFAGGFMDSIGEMMEGKLNGLVEEHGREYLERVIGNECDSLLDKPAGQGISLLDDSGFDLVALTTEVYEMVINDHLGQMLESLNLQKVVEDRINSMKVEEVEELVLTIMKKELGAIVNLGAVIGFILGLVNILIMTI